MTTATSIVDTTNGIIDAIQAAADNPLISLIGLVLPQANSIIDVIRRYRPTIDAAQPIIRTAVEAGEPVFEKVVEQLPKFGTVVSAITHMMPPHVGSAGTMSGAVAENIARTLGGFGRMTPEQERRWMDSMTPGNDPSQENSRLGSG